MSPVVRIPEGTYQRLKSLAEPFVDSPATVVERLLDFHDECSETNGIPKKGDEPLSRDDLEPSQGNDEVLSFAKQLDARDLRDLRSHDPRLATIRRRNYFVLGKETYLIVKISRIDSPFFGLGRRFVDLFNELTEDSGAYYFVGLDSHSTGWLISRDRLLRDIANGSISRSAEGPDMQYKIHSHNLRSQHRFLSIADCRSKIGRGI